jgi:hypothetical protein
MKGIPLYVANKQQGVAWCMDRARVDASGPGYRGGAWHCVCVCGVVKPPLQAK